MSELGRIKSLLPLREMAISFGLIEEKPKGIRGKQRGISILEDLHSFVIPEVDGGTEWKHSLLDFLRHPHSKCG